MVKKIEFFKCYSINLLRFIKAHNVRYISKFINDRTNKTCWLFIIDDKLSEILKKYSESKSDSV